MGTIFAGLALVSGVCALGTVAGAQSGAACRSPYAPVFTGSGYSQDQGHPFVGPTVPDVVIFDTTVLDAGGAALISAANGTEIVATRPAGALRLSSGGATLVATSAGDLDGDGLAEIWVGDEATGSAWVVPGDTAPGTHGLADVGIEVPQGVALGSRPDGAPMDLYLSGDEGTAVYDGEQVLAAAPGGDATGLEPLAEYPDRIPLSLLRFDSGDHLVLAPVSLRGTIRVVSPAEVFEFSTPPGIELRVGSVSVRGRDGDRGRFLQVMTQDRSPVKYLWSFDDPCTALEAAAEATTTTSTTAPAADPAPLSLTG